MRKLLKRIREFGHLRAVSLVSACALSAQAEFTLASAIGIPGALAGAFPAAVDALMLAALQHRRFVAVASLLMAALNVASHLLVSPVAGLHPAFVACISAVPVLVVYLIERMAPREAISVSLATPERVSEENSAERVEAREKGIQGTPSIAPPALPLAAPASSAPNADPLQSDARALDTASRDATGKPVALRELQRELRIGQKRAQRIRLALT